MRRVKSMNELPVGTQISIKLSDRPGAPILTGSIVSWEDPWGEGSMPIFLSETEHSAFHDCDGHTPNFRGFWIDNHEITSKEIYIISKGEKKKTGFGKFITTVEARP